MKKMESLASSLFLPLTDAETRGIAGGLTAHATGGRTGAFPNPDFKPDVILD